jgi:hypothetical protein
MSLRWFESQGNVALIATLSADANALFCESLSESGLQSFGLSALTASCRG